MAIPKDETQPASARTLGAAIRKALKAMGLPWKVSAKTTSFAGFGYGSMPFANIETERKLTYMERSRLADTLRNLRADPEGGKGIIQLSGEDYAFGGSIGHADNPSGKEFWERYKLDVAVYDKEEFQDPDGVGLRHYITPVMREAARRAEIAYAFEKPGLPRDMWVKAWMQGGSDTPENWGAGWPDIYTHEEAPAGWPGIEAFEDHLTQQPA